MNDVRSALQLVRVTLEERRGFLLLTPPHLIPILNNGAGDLHCLDTSRLVNGERPVVCWNQELEEDQIPDKQAPGFLPWLSEELDRAQGQPERS